MDSILSVVMRVAKEITRAERGMSVTSDLTIIDIENITTDIVTDEAFQTAALKSLSKAIETNQSVLTNNIITDLAQAPVTNTNFTDLRVIVAIPVQGQGAIYLDQHIRDGMFQRDIIDRLNRMVTAIIDRDDLSLDADQIRKIYDALD
jgi:uncharacterized coiled-coil protein SlyX